MPARCEQASTYELTAAGQPVAIVCSKVHDRLVRPHRHAQAGNRRLTGKIKVKGLGTKDG